MVQYVLNYVRKLPYIFKRCNDTVVRNVKSLSSNYLALNFSSRIYLEQITLVYILHTSPTKRVCLQNFKDISQFGRSIDLLEMYHAHCALQIFPCCASLITSASLAIP